MKDNFFGKVLKVIGKGTDYDKEKGIKNKNRKRASKNDSKRKNR